MMIDDLPQFILKDTSPINEQIRDFLLSNFNLVYDWLDIRSVKTEVEQGRLVLYYSSFVPEDFISQNKNIEFIDIKNLDEYCQLALSEAIRLPVY